MSKIKNKFKKYIDDPFYKNSLALVSSRIFNMACGLLFWLIAARLYPIEDVGTSTALISSLSLVILLSRFGFDFSLIRFLPNNENIFSSCLIITTVSTIIVGTIYLLFIDNFSPELNFMKAINYIIIFLFFAVMNSIILVTGDTFISVRKPTPYFTQNIVMGSRILFLFPLVFLGHFGIFSSIGLAYILTSIFTLCTLKRSINLDFSIKKSFIKESIGFSLGNYVSSILSAVPMLILPLMILNLLDEAEVGKYAIAFSISNLVLIIPEALSTSLFVEGSHGQSLRKNVLKAVLVNCLILIPIVLFICLFGKELLGLFGEKYMEAFDLLRLMALSSFFVVIYLLFTSIQNVRMHVKSIIRLNFGRFLILLILNYFFISEFKLMGVAYAWLTAYGVLNLGIILIARKEKWI